MKKQLEFSLFLFVTLFFTTSCGFAGGIWGLVSSNKGETVTSGNTVALQTNGSQASQVKVPGGAELKLPPATVKENAEIKVSQQKPEDTANIQQALADDTKAVSQVYQISSSQAYIPKTPNEAITLKIPYDSEKIPTNQENNLNTYALYWNGEAWLPLFGQTDNSNHMLTVSLGSLPASQQTESLKLIAVSSNDYEAYSDSGSGLSTQAEGETNSQLACQEDGNFVVLYHRGFIAQLFQGDASKATQSAKTVRNVLNTSIQYYKERGFDDPVLAKDESCGNKYKAVIPKMPLFGKSKDCGPGTLGYYNGQMMYICPEAVKDDYILQITTAHELFHAFQSSYEPEGSVLREISSDCPGYDRPYYTHSWFTEGTADALAATYYNHDTPAIDGKSDPPRDLTIPLITCKQYQNYATQEFWSFMERQKPGRWKNIRKILEDNRTLQTQQELFKTIYEQTIQLSFAHFAFDRVYEHQFSIQHADQQNRLVADYSRTYSFEPKSWLPSLTSASEKELQPNGPARISIHTNGALTAGIGRIKALQINGAVKLSFQASLNDYYVKIYPERNGAGDPSMAKEWPRDSVNNSLTLPGFGQPGGYDGIFIAAATANHAPQSDLVISAEVGSASPPGPGSGLGSISLIVE